MDSFVGNSKIVSEIKKIISNQTVSNAYLFSGTDGIGKFTLSKIFAKAILCENPLNGAPCGKCEACLTFDSMADLIIIEPEDELIKIEKIRYAISELMLKPTISNKKVCIINDADCMNSSSQNALLKVLEESCPNYLANKLSTKVVDITKKFPFDDSNFDGVFCTGTLHLFEKETILKILQ